MPPAPAAHFAAAGCVSPEHADLDKIWGMERVPASRSPKELPIAVKESR